MLLGIIDPDEGLRRVFGHDRRYDVGRWWCEQDQLEPTVQSSFRKGRLII